MTKKYQMSRFDTSALAVPERVSVAMAEVAADMREGLLALAVGAGLQVMQSLMDEDVAACCGPRGRHDPDRTATRHGSERGSVTLGGRRVPMRRPRVRASDGSGEVPLPAYELFSSTELLGKLAMERMLAGVSTRRYPAALEPVGEQVSRDATATSKSAVSRRFVAMTETALADLLAADLSGLDLVAIMIDGVHFADHLCVVALGIGIDGSKHPLALVEGSTENTTLVRSLLVGLRHCSGRLQVLHWRFDEPYSDDGTHLHRESDEVYVVLEGAIDLEADGSTVTVSAGERSRSARGVSHPLVAVQHPARGLTIRGPAINDKVVTG